MLPTVSVVIPTYNRWPMVGAAIESVLAQSYREYELIVVDDGSTDDTARELAKFGARLRLFRQPRAGVSAARNNGVRRCRGKWVAFLDSDDLWRPTKLAVQVSFKERHPEIQICQTEELWIRNGVRVNPKAKHLKPTGDIFARSLEICLISPSAVMMTRDLFEQAGGFDESFPVCEDYDLWLRIAATHLVPLIPEPLVVKRGGHADQLSRSTWGMDWYRVLALQKLLRSGLGGARRAAALQVLQRKVAVLTQGARKRGKDREVQKYQSVLNEFYQEIGDVGQRVSQLRASEGLSSKNPGPLA